MQISEKAVDGLCELGLSAYEAAVFAGLQALGTGSASEVADVTDVPRSQVYGATDGLEKRGLIDVQEGTPTVYRPVPVDRARERLYERLDRRVTPAFEYLEEIAGARADEDRGAEAVWRTDERANVAARAAALIDDADATVVYGAGDPARVEEPVGAALSRAAERGCTVTVVSADRAVLDAAADTGIDRRPVEDRAAPDVSNGRVVVVDDRAVLVSVLPTESVPTVTEETAFWSADTAFAGVLATLIGQWLSEHVA